MSGFAFLLVAVTAPTLVSVPAHVQYCQSSNAIIGSQYAKPEIRDGVFDTISERIKQAGLTARTLTIGVPFVDEIKRTPSPGATPTDPDELNASYVVRICSVVPADKAAAFPAAGVMPVAAKQVYATLCYASDLEECRRVVNTTVLSAQPVGGAKRVLLRTRQALSSDGAPGSLSAALSDVTLIKLRESDAPAGPATPPPAAPVDYAVVSGELAP